MEVTLIVKLLALLCQGINYGRNMFITFAPGMLDNFESNEVSKPRCLWQD